MRGWGWLFFCWDGWLLTSCGRRRRDKMPVKYYIVPVILALSVTTAAYSRVINITPETIIDVAAARSGDIISLVPGIYTVNLVLNDGVNLIAAANESSILLPEDTAKPAITKYGGGYVENIIVQGGIYVSNSSATFRNIRINGNRGHGLTAAYFSGSLEESRISANDGDGIKAYHSQFRVSQSTIFDNRDDGIELLHCAAQIDSCVIERNLDNGIEFWFDAGTAVNVSVLNNNRKPIGVVADGAVPVFTLTTADSQPLEIAVGRADWRPALPGSTPEPEPDTAAPAVSSPAHFLQDTMSIREALDLLLLTPPDFCLSHRIDTPALEIPQFTELFAKPLDSGKYLKECADTLLALPDAASRIQFLLQDKETFTEYMNSAAGLKLSARLPHELTEVIQHLYWLSSCYVDQYYIIKFQFTMEEWDFIEQEMRQAFGSGRLRSLTLREELQAKDDDDERQARLKEILKRLDLAPLRRLGREIIRFAEKIVNLDMSAVPKNINFRKTTPLGTILITGDRVNRHEDSDYFILIDCGGDDEYRNRVAVSRPDKPVSLYFDFSGNDDYTAESNDDICWSYWGVSAIFDKTGNDRYRGAGNSVAATYFGLSAIIDQAGDDSYEAGNYGLAAGCFGVGMIDDNSGNDLYNGSANIQGFGLTGGYGILIDRGGNDYYLSGNRMSDSIRNASHSLTMSQGCGMGMRPYIPGGMGILIDAAGNDVYKADVFGQGVGYWLALGGLIDYSGDDRYDAFSYMQGAGVHLSIGCLLELGGDDKYSGNNLGQGCGHDMSFGLLTDLAGNDCYQLNGLGQGAGYANGIGLLIEESGKDMYAADHKDLGYGEYFRDREFGSIGIMLDNGGDDYYLRRKNQSWERAGKYGLFYDK